MISLILLVAMSVHTLFLKKAPPVVYDDHGRNLLPDMSDQEKANIKAYLQWKHGDWE